MAINKELLGAYKQLKAELQEATEKVRRTESQFAALRQQLLDVRAALEGGGAAAAGAGGKQWWAVLAGGNGRKGAGGDDGEARRRSAARVVAGAVTWNGWRRAAAWRCRAIRSYGATWSCGATGGCLRRA